MGATGATRTRRPQDMGAEKPADRPTAEERALGPARAVMLYFCDEKRLKRKCRSARRGDRRGGQGLEDAATPRAPPTPTPSRMALPHPMLDRPPRRHAAPVTLVPDIDTVPFSYRDRGSRGLSARSHARGAENQADVVSSTRTSAMRRSRARLSTPELSLGRSSSSAWPELKLSTFRGRRRRPGRAAVAGRASVRGRSSRSRTGKRGVLEAPPERGFVFSRRGRRWISSPRSSADHARGLRARTLRGTGARDPVGDCGACKRMRGTSASG